MNIENDRTVRRLRGQQSRAAGEYFENLLSGSCKWYAMKGLAKIEKTPEPMKPLRAPNRQGQFLACFTKQAQPDYKGTLKGGRAIVFEAKHTEADRIERKRLTQEQLDDLEAHHKLGALCFVVVSFNLQRFYRVPWMVWRDMKQRYGRLYIKETELAAFRIPAVGGTIKLLDGLLNEKPIRDDRCVCCGAYIPEGTQVCSHCKKEVEG
ncbi:MAG: Holliday junction resolvase RecU [Paludibacteraceae bacterium]|nr:Holliday junction resolvase RecU [Clostridia bacterium]MBQ9229058.1 Holliday junction resolvase RecU [Eubacterium sp.]MBR1630471.1 Holliday junction resolvase RecU [Paludibacteraceae bacterium]